MMVSIRRSKMLKLRSIRVVLTFLIFVLASTACSFAALAEPTETPEPTATFTPVPTSTPTATFTPKPTSTSTPVPTPTLVPVMGEPVSSENWEITVIDAIYRERIYPGGGYYYYPNPGYIFIDVGLKVKSLGSATSVISSDIVILDENGEAWHALWSGENVVRSEDFDPFNIAMNPNLDENIDISTEKYLRLVFVIYETSLEEEIYFKFEDVPAVPFTLDSPP